MSRIPTPISTDAAPAASRGSLQAVKNLLGSVPNLFRILATSPQALEGFLGLNGALGKGALSIRTRERIALALAEFHGCDYCLAAHSYLGTNLAKLSDSEIKASRLGTSGNDRAATAVGFALNIAKNRGKVSDSEFQAVRAAGYNDAEIVEIVGHVVLNTFSNYINEVLETEIDFPVAEQLVA